MFAAHKARYPGMWMPRRQPVGRMRINRAHPLAAGLSACYVASAGFGDIAGNTPAGVPTGGATLGIGPGGAGYGTDGSSAYIAIPYGAAFAGNEASMMVVATPATAGAGVMFGRWWSGGNWGFALQAESDYVNLRWGVSGGASGHFNDYRFSPGQTFAAVGTVSGSANVAALSCNGISGSTTAGAVALSEAPMGIGAWNDGGSWGNYFNGRVYIAAYWTRALSLAEAKWLSLEPYAFLMAEG